MEKFINNLLENACQWAKEAGKIQLRYFRGKHLDIQTKFNLHDVVTVADKESEKYLIEQINKIYPEHSVLGEESGEHSGSAEFRWVIDPLDGTTNYSQGLPLFSVSIGIQFKGETIIGVVYAPYLDELYTAVIRSGAFLNGHPIQVSRKTELERSVLSTGFPIDKDRNPDNNIDNLIRVLPHVRGIRRLGSAAYDLCCVASGTLDGYWELDLHSWDVCAGELIVKEAGGEIRSFRSDRGISILAGSKEIVRKTLPFLSERPYNP